MTPNNAIPDVRGAFDAIVDAMEEQIRKLRTFAAENLAKPVAVNGATEQIISVADASDLIRQVNEEDHR